MRTATALLALLLLLSGCAAQLPGSSSGGASSSLTHQEPEQDPQPLPFTLAVYPSYSLHPALAVNRANLTLAPLIYEPLFELDGQFQPQPVLCQSWLASEDKLVWTFTLRSGITFSDGTPLTAEEAAQALELARSSKGRYAQRLADVASISGEGQILTVTLRRPNGNLPALLDIPIALGGGDRPLGTGPYVLSGTEDALSLTARSGWWQTDKRLPVQTIPLHPVSKSDELIYAFDAGEVSLVDVDLMATNAMGYRGNYQTWDYPTADFLYLGFNTQEGPCRSPQLRRALARLVDRESIASSLYANHAVPTLLPVHPSSPLYDAASGVPEYAPEALQAEQVQLEGREVVFLVNSENVSKASAAQRITYQLQAAGLTVELRQLSFEDYSTALARGEFDLYLGETVFTAGFDLQPLLGSSGALNYGRWWAEGADGLLWIMHAAAPEDKPTAAQAVFQLLQEQMPIVPIAFKNGSVLTQWGRLSGLSPARGNVFYQIENWTVK